MIGVFIDTFIVLTMTALVILSSGLLQPLQEGGLTGTALAQAAFNQAFGSFGNAFVAVCMLFFAFSTIIGWYFFGETNVKALFGPKAVKPYAVIAVVCIVIGSVQKECDRKIRELMAAEDVEKGVVFPQEIHALHQEKNMLETHMQYRRVRIRRLRLYKGLDR